MVPIPNASSLVNSSDRQNSSQSDRPDSQLSITVEVVTLDIPSPEVLSQAFEKIRGLDHYIKPIVMERFAKKLKVSKKTLEKSFEIWAMERISQIAANDAAQNNNSNNGEEV